MPDEKDKTIKDKTIDESRRRFLKAAGAAVPAGLYLQSDARGEEDVSAPPQTDSSVNRKNKLPFGNDR